MSDPQTTPPAAKSQGKRDSAENMEQYMLYNHHGIGQKLRLLAKNHITISASFNAGADTMNTVILDVIWDMDLVAIDYSPSESMNKKLLEARRIIFTANFDGVDVKFTANSITKAKYQGESVLAIPLPESLLWVQRREFFRVRIPLGVPAHCEIPQDDGSLRKYRLYDISAGGIAIIDEYQDLQVEPGIILTGCNLELPDHGSSQISLEVRNQFPVRHGDDNAGVRIGCQYVDLGMSFAATIQRYIHAIESARRRLEE